MILINKQSTKVSDTNLMQNWDKNDILFQRGLIEKQNFVMVKGR